MRRRSFRDPLGSVYEVDQRIVRVLTADADDVLEFLNSSWAMDRVAAGTLIDSVQTIAPPKINEPSAAEKGPSRSIEHPRVPFVSYPYEWPAGMLYDAATLTLDIAESLLPLGWRLKDATPFNVLFRHTRPVFVDVMSFERRPQGDNIWVAYAQFVRTFVLPLLSERFGTTSASALALSRDGVAPSQLVRAAGPLQRLSSPYFQLVTLPALLDGKRRQRTAPMRPSRKVTDEQAVFVLQHTFKGLRGHLEQVKPDRTAASPWSDYAAISPYTESGRSAKSNWISNTLGRLGPAEVLDLGANTGDFSVLAARAGASVVAIDNDAVSVGRLYDHARAEGLSILPLVVDVVDPTPARGWCNDERPSFLERFENRFDLVMALGLIHHIAGNDRIPVPQILALLERLSSRYVIVEYVHPDDPMFRQVLAGRPVPEGLDTGENFEAACQRRFSVRSSFAVPQSARILLLLEKH